MSKDGIRMAAPEPQTDYERSLELASRLKAAQAIPARLCNSTSVAPYTGPAWNSGRLDADAFLKHKSRGWV